VCSIEVIRTEKQKFLGEDYISRDLCCGPISDQVQGNNPNYTYFGVLQGRGTCRSMSTHGAKV
jgi:hypothetical protein